MANSVTAVDSALSLAVISAPAGPDLSPPRQGLTPPAIPPYHRGLEASTRQAKKDLTEKLREGLT